MAKRELNSRLEKLYDEGHEVYSISKLNTMAQCPYQAYLNYVKKEKSKPNAWALLGGNIHDALQECVDTGCDTEIVRKSIEKELENLEFLGIDFPSESIRENWIKNMTAFADAFKTPDGKFETEQFVLYKVSDDVWMQGYIDLLEYNEDGTVSIYDWKTSSKFTKDKLTEAGRQLILYALAKEQEGYKISKIAWRMLKYCKVRKQLKSGKIKESVMEWRKFEPGENIISVEPYIQEYEFSKENIEETLNYMNKMIRKYQIYGEDEGAYDSCNINKNSYFCSNLCGYSNKCKWYRDYLEQRQGETKDIDDDLF